MSEQGPTVSQEFTPIPRTTQWLIGRYANILKSYHELGEELLVADEAIAQINQGLPSGLKVGTKTSWSPEVLRNGYGGYSRIYRPNESGDYSVAGEICTEGAGEPFLGDKILKLDDGELVVINDELQLGLSVMGEVFIVDTVNDPSRRSIGGSQTERFEGLLSLIQQVEPGERATHDHSWL